MKKIDFKKIIEKIRFEASEYSENVASHGKVILITVVLTFIVMFAVALSIFFVSVQGAEKVRVPNVKGMSWNNAFLEMQTRQLYPKLQLRYSDLPGEKGLVIDQYPKEGSIVKAYRTITVTVSRGVAIEEFEDYTGKDIDSVQDSLDLLFSGSDSLVKVSRPVYVKSDSPVGTILEQFPAAGTPIEDHMRLQFVVSSGNKNIEVEVPSVEGKSIKGFLAQMNNTNNQVTYNIFLTEDSSAPREGKVISQEKVGKKVKPYSRSDVKLSVRPASQESSNVQGVFAYNLPEYPFAVSVRLDAVSPDGNQTTVADFNHPGKSITIPYDVKKGSTLILYVMNEEKTREIVE